MRFLNMTTGTEKAVLMTLAILVFFTVLFYTWDFFAKKEFLKSIKERVNSWWVIFTIVIIIIGTTRELAFIIFAIISFISFRELTSKLNFSHKHRRTIMLAYLAIPLQYYFSYQKLFIPFLILIPVGMLLLLPFRSILEDNSEDSIKTFSQLQWSLMLTVFSLSHMSFLMSLPNIETIGEGAPGLIFFLILITQLNDVCQFIFGKLFGKRKITPVISPNKTLAGLLGGIFGSVALGYLFKGLLPFNDKQVILISALIAVCGFFGDLNISAIKRDLKIKDMSNLIPGHGGILDRLDSLIFSNVVFFYLVYYWIYT